MLGAIVVGCNNSAKEFKAELAAIDSLQVVVENYQTNMDTINTEEMSALAKEVDRQYIFITDNYKDTSSRDFWVRDMSYYKGIMKTFVHFDEGQEKVKKELSECGSQLASLENSIKDGKLERPEVEKYLGEEVNALQQAQMHYNKIALNLGGQLKLYNEFKPKMDSVETLVKSAGE